MNSIRRRALASASAPLLAAAVLTGCTGGPEGGSGGSGDDAPSPEEVLAGAKETLDATEGVRISMRTDQDPGGDYLSEATGVITADPAAFDGTISGSVSGLPGSDIAVVSVDGTVYIDVPLIGWTDQYQPDQFCAPDPATLLDPDSGVSGVLTSATDLEAGDAERSTEDASVVITPYSGTVPGEAIRAILPCAEGDEVEATFEVDDDGRLRSAELTGAFFPDSEAITYRIAVEEYDVTQDITAPE